MANLQEGSITCGCAVGIRDNHTISAVIIAGHITERKCVRGAIDIHAILLPLVTKWRSTICIHRKGHRPANSRIRIHRLQGKCRHRDNG